LIPHGALVLHVQLEETDGSALIWRWWLPHPIEGVSQQVMMASWGGTGALEKNLNKGRLWSRQDMAAPMRCCLVEGITVAACMYSLMLLREKL
jgi:hypothetical protein